MNFKTLQQFAAVFLVVAATSYAAAQQAPSSEGAVASPPAGASAAPSQANPSSDSSTARGSPSSPIGTTTMPAQQPAAGVEPDNAAASPGAVQALPQALLPRDLSPWSMFLNADIVVKIVMIGLAFASLVTWTVWLAKGAELITAKRRATTALRKLERADSLTAAADDIEQGWTRRGPIARLLDVATGEVRRSNGLSADGIKERVGVALSRVEARAARSMVRGTGLLATIGATAPFVGLFGTVWGIMNSFVGISQAHTTNLAVVAPGIAEALLATAIGLVAAIPAVIIYNVFTRAIAGYRALLADASAEILKHLSRDLEAHGSSRAHQDGELTLARATPLPAARRATQSLGGGR